MRGRLAKEGRGTDQAKRLVRKVAEPGGEVLQEYLRALSHRDEESRRRVIAEVVERIGAR